MCYEYVNYTDPEKLFLNYFIIIGLLYQCQTLHSITKLTNLILTPCNDEIE